MREQPRFRRYTMRHAANLMAKISENVWLF